MRSLGPSFKVQVLLIGVVLLVAAAMAVAFRTNGAPAAQRSLITQSQQLGSPDVPDELVPDVSPQIADEPGVPGLPGTSTSGPLPKRPRVASAAISSVPGSGPQVPQIPAFSAPSITSGANVVPDDLDDQFSPESLSGEDGEADGPGEDGKQTYGKSTVSGPGGAGEGGDSEDDGEDADDRKSDD